MWPYRIDRQRSFGGMPRLQHLSAMNPGTPMAHGRGSFICVRLVMDLFFAADVGDLERVKLLVEQGMDKDVIDAANGKTPLYKASRNGHLPVVRYLVEQGARKDRANFNGVAPLIVASYKGHTDVVHYLLEQGADKDKPTDRGNSSLHFAVRFGHLDIVMLLLVYGADLNARNDNGEMPIDKTSNEEIRQILLDEPERRLQPQPRKRCIETKELSITQTADGDPEEGKVADGDNDSESDSDEDGDKGDRW